MTNGQGQGKETISAEAYEKIQLKAAKLGLTPSQWISFQAGAGEADDALARAKSAAGPGGGGSAVDEMGKVYAVQEMKKVLRKGKGSDDDEEDDDVSGMGGIMKTIKELMVLRETMQMMKGLFGEGDGGGSRKELESELKELRKELAELRTGGGTRVGVADALQAKLDVFEKEMERRDKTAQERFEKFLEKNEKEKEEGKILTAIAGLKKEREEDRTFLNEQLRRYSEELQEARQEFSRGRPPEGPPPKRKVVDLSVQEARDLRDDMMREGFVQAPDADASDRKLREEAVRRKLERQGKVEDKVLNEVDGVLKDVREVLKPHVSQFVGDVISDANKQRMKAMGFPVDDLQSARTPEERDAAWKKMAEKLQEKEREAEQLRAEIQAREQVAAQARAQAQAPPRQQAPAAQQTTPPAEPPQTWSISGVPQAGSKAPAAPSEGEEDSEDEEDEVEAEAAGE